MKDDLDRLAFERMLNESSGPSPLATSAFDSMVGLAVRRWCAPLLDLEPLVSAEEYVRRRHRERRPDRSATAAR